MESLCKWHVIVKHLLKHDSQELFFPIVTCAFWLNVVLQSLIYIAFIDTMEISLNSEIAEIAIVLFFFLTIVVLFLSVKDKARYQRAENWFIGLDSKSSTMVKFSVGVFMLLSFFTLILWAIYLM